MQIFVVGSSCADVVVPIPTLPAPGVTVLAGDDVPAEPMSGGKGANVAVAAARLRGSGVALCSALGRDAHGDTLRAAYAAEAPALRYFAAVPDAGRATGVAYCFSDPAGESSIVVVPGANNAFDALPAEAAAAVAGARVVVLGAEANLACAEAAVALRGPETVVVLNASPVPATAEGRARLAALCMGGGVDVVVMNEGERDSLGLAQGPAAPIFIVTHGSKGSSWVQENKGGGKTDTTTVTVPGVEVEAVVDTTGAGDAFLAALAVDIEKHFVRSNLRTATHEERALTLAFANERAAATVGHLGAQPSYIWD